MEVIAPPKRLSCLYWSEIEKWTLTSSLLRFGKLPDGWRLLPVNDFATQINNKKKVEPNAEYRMAGVKWYGKGVFHRETVVGKDQSANYLNPLKPDALIYNRLFAWKESFAVVTGDFAGFYVSNEFPQFEINKIIALPEYIYLLFTSKKIIKAVNASSIGSAAISRNRFKESDFFGFKVPIPPIPVQQKIVAYWKAATVEVSQLKDQAKAIIDKSTCTFIHELGLSIPKKQELEKVFITQWAAFDRWSVSYNQAAKTMLDLSKGKFPVVELGSILEHVQYGTSEKSNTDRSGVPILRINNIKEGHVDTTDLKHISLGDKTLENLALVDGDILIIRTSGSRNLVGTCAVFHEKDKFVYASYLIRLKVSHKKTLSDYVSIYINSPVGRQQVNLLSRQIMQNNINSQEIKSLKIPLPPLPLQKEIVQGINYAHQEAALLKRGAKDRLEKATIGIEQMIIGTRPVEAH